ncbi:MAG: protein-glutamate O-methyltransferase CheR [Deltaproteobacteria bacterium]|nr:protein-glutamate O-methyltransferase CheR [Deltaproteobacteria bacterium]
MEEFRLLRDLIYEHCGIFFQDDSKYLVHRRLAPRLEALSLPNFSDYYRFLRYDPDRRAEFEEIVERVTTNETYFFREMYQLEALRDEIFPELQERQPRGRRMTIWSAGCSTGEEAYTIAILVLESGRFRDWDVRVFGSDISRRVLSIARKGMYGRSSFRSTDERYLRRYFREIDGKYHVREEVKALTSFGQLNLLDEEMLSIVGDVDVILCRNVLIYFDLEARKRTIGAFYRKLLKGGYLLLGHSESLLNISTAFELVHLKRDMVYRKPLVMAPASKDTQAPSAPRSATRFPTEPGWKTNDAPKAGPRVDKTGGGSEPAPDKRASSAWGNSQNSVAAEGRQSEGRSTLDRSSDRLGDRLDRTGERRGAAERPLERDPRVLGQSAIPSGVSPKANDSSDGDDLKLDPPQPSRMGRLLPRGAKDS